MAPLSMVREASRNETSQLPSKEFPHYNLGDLGLVPRPRKLVTKQAAIASKVSHLSPTTRIGVKSSVAVGKLTSHALHRHDKLPVIEQKSVWRGGGKIALNPVRGPPFPVFAAFFDLPVRFLCSCNNAAPPPAANRCRSRSLVCGGGKNRTKVSRSSTVASAYSPTGRPFSLSIVLVAHCVYSFACGAKLRACRNTISNTDAELPLFASQHAVLVRWSFCDRANRLSKVGFVQSNRVRTI